MNTMYRIHHKLITKAWMSRFLMRYKVTRRNKREGKLDKTREEINRLLNVLVKIKGPSGKECMETLLKLIIRIHYIMQQLTFSVKKYIYIERIG